MLEMATREADGDLIGEKLGGRWRVVGLLGRGGMCSVYEAVQPDGTRVALKVLNPSLAQHPRARDRFLREGRIANAVEHPNAVRVTDSQVDAGNRFFLVMERLEGETLQARRLGAGGRLAVDEVVRYADGILDVLAAAHAKAIFHRDIKPANVFLTRDGKVKVLDFGIAAVRDEAEEGPITQSGVSLGTPAFMAPEQARGRHLHVDARTDVWAVGATMFVCLAGRHVHGDASTPNEALIFSATQPAPPLGRFCPHVPREVAAVVDRALALDPARRWESAAAMQSALLITTKATAEAPAAPGARPSVGDAETPTRDETHGPPRRWSRRRWSRRGWAAPGAAAALVGVAVAGGALWPRAGRAPATVTAVAPVAERPVGSPPSPADPPPAPPARAPLAVPTSTVPRSRPVARSGAALVHDGIPDAVLDRRK